MQNARSKTPLPQRSVLIVEPDDYRRQRHLLCIERDDGFAVASALATKREALAFLMRRPVDFIVTNSMLPDGSPADIIRAAVRRNPDCLTLAASACEDAKVVMHTMASGANGYVLFSDTAHDLATSLRVLQAGGCPVSPVVARTVLRCLQSRRTQDETLSPDNPLSPRELDILRLLSRGVTFVEIGQILTLSKSTVSTHTKNIYRKLEAHSRDEALFKARELQIL